MNAIERKRYILDELQRNGSVVITDLAERIQVSSMTIRRDLNAMAEDGMVTLEHGGAVLNNGSLFECSISFKSEINAAEKKRIAAKCMEYINEGDSIFLDTGTTPNELAMLLRGKRNTVCLPTRCWWPTPPLPCGTSNSSCARVSSAKTPWAF